MTPLAALRAILLSVMLTCAIPSLASAEVSQSDQQGLECRAARTVRAISKQSWKAIEENTPEEEAKKQNEKVLEFARQLVAEEYPNSEDHLAAFDAAYYYRYFALHTAINTKSPEDISKVLEAAQSCESRSFF